MPKPNPNESRDDFISRCIPIVIEDGSAETQDQAIAVCSSIWESEKEFEDIIQEIDETMNKRTTTEYVKIGVIDEDKRTVEAVISSDTVDRDNEILVPRGVILENFQKNPVVLWMHNHSIPPIGKAEILKVGFKRIVARVKFAATPFAEEIFQLFKQGFMRAFSVGFMPEKSHEPTPDEIRKNPEWANARRIFDKWHLLEFSAVSVPANPDALALAVKNKSITLCDELKEQLDIPEIYDLTEPIKVRNMKIEINDPIKVKEIKVKEVDIEAIKSEQVKIAIAKYKGKMFLP